MLDLVGSYTLHGVVAIQAVLPPPVMATIRRYSQTHLKWRALDLIMSIHLGSVSTYLCFILYIVSKQDKTNDIRLCGLST